MGTQVALRERHENVGGFSTRVARTDGVGPAVVLVHGFGDSADTWRPLMRRLVAAGTRMSCSIFPASPRRSGFDRD